MKHQRSFAVELKRQVVEELLSGISAPAQLIRRYDISSGLFCHWKEQYARGPFVTAEEKRRFIAEHRHLLKSAERGCELINLHRSTYYHKPKNDAEDDRDFINSIETIIEEFPSY
jgi:transposase-like protein